MKKVIIGVHGLGNKPPKYMLQKWWKDAIMEGFSKQGIKNKLPKFELVYWADILYDKPLDKWEKNKESPYFMDEPYKKSPTNFVVEDRTFHKRIVDFLSAQLNKIFLNEDKTLNYKFISEYILHNFFKDLGIYYNDKCDDSEDFNCHAKHLIRKRTKELIKKYDGYEIMLIAHSMGSIIAFDVLTFLIPEVKIHTFLTIGSPLGLPVVISNIASEYLKKTNAYKNPTTPPGVTHNWFNLADISDNVALNYMLNDDFGPNDLGISPIDFEVVNDYEAYTIKNPHKSFGYLRTPELAQILDVFIKGEKQNFAKKLIGGVKSLVDDIKEQTEFVKDRLNVK